MFGFRKAEVADVPAIQEIAQQTWPVTYDAIIGKNQVNYMLGLLYSKAALTENFEEGQSFYFIYKEKEIIGFCAFGALNTDTYKLYKIYILPFPSKLRCRPGIARIYNPESHFSGCCFITFKRKPAQQSKKFLRENGLQNTV